MPTSEDRKISQLPIATTLESTDIFPLVRNGANYQMNAVALRQLIDTWSIRIEKPSDKDYLIDQAASFSYQVISIKLSCGSGSCNVTLVKNSTAYTEATDLPVTTTLNTINFTNSLSIEALDSLLITVSSTSGIEDLAIDLVIERF
jgi:hypothetical protein